MRPMLTTICEEKRRARYRFTREGERQASQTLGVEAFHTGCFSDTLRQGSCTVRTQLSFLPSSAAAGSVLRCPVNTGRVHVPAVHVTEAGLMQVTLVPWTKELPSRNTNCRPRGNGTPRTLEEAWNCGRPSPGFVTAADAIWLSPLAPPGLVPLPSQEAVGPLGWDSLHATCPRAPASRLLNGAYARATCEPPL